MEGEVGMGCGEGEKGLGSAGSMTGSVKGGGAIREVLPFLIPAFLSLTKIALLRIFRLHYRHQGDTTLAPDVHARFESWLLIGRAISHMRTPL